MSLELKEKTTLSVKKSSILILKEILMTKKGGGANLNRIESPPYPASLIGQIRIRGQATSTCISLSFPTPDPQLNLRNPTTSDTHKRFIVVVAETASPFSAITDKCEVP